MLHGIYQWAQRTLAAIRNLESDGDENSIGYYAALSERASFTSYSPNTARRAFRSYARPCFTGLQRWTPSALAYVESARRR